MIQATITSNLVQNQHRIVKLQYFENITRYYRFFQIYSQNIEQVIDHFIGPHGLHNSDPKLRSRVSYLFSRFTKDLKNLLSNFIEKILNSIQDLLIIQSPLQSQTLGQEGPLSVDDQLFLYETVSVLIVSSNLEPKIKAQLMKSLLSPLVGCFGELLTKYCEIQDEKIKLIYAKSLNAAMLVASRVSKGFSNQIKVKDCECVELFLEILRIFLPSINVTTHKNLIHVGFRQYLHRMIVCLDNEVFEYLPLTIEHLIKISNEPKDLYDLVPLLSQIVNKYKQQIVRFMQSILMQFVTAVTNYTNSLPADIINNLFKASSTNLSNQTVLSSTSPVTANNNNSIEPQFIVDVQQLYRAYFQFMLNIINNDLVDIISAQQPNDIYKIFFTLLQGAQIGSQDISKSCFQVIRKLISVFGNYFLHLKCY
jgi:exportin-T